MIEILLIIVVGCALFRELNSIMSVLQTLLLPDEKIVEEEPRARASAAKSLALAVCVILVVFILMGVGAMAGVQP